MLILISILPTVCSKTGREPGTASLYVMAAKDCADIFPLAGICDVHVVNEKPSASDLGLGTLLPRLMSFGLRGSVMFFPALGLVVKPSMTLFPALGLVAKPSMTLGLGDLILLQFAGGGAFARPGGQEDEGLETVRVLGMAFGAELTFVNPPWTAASTACPGFTVSVRGVGAKSCASWCWNVCKRRHRHWHINTWGARAD